MSYAYIKVAMQENTVSLSIKNKIDEEHRIKITEQRNDFSILSIFTYTQNQEIKKIGCLCSILIHNIEPAG